MQKKSISDGILFTDFYQLTMAQLYFEVGLHERPVQFDYFFRNYPDYGAHQAGFCITAGLGDILNWMQKNRFTEQDIDLLRDHKDPSGKQIFKDGFLSWLKENGNFDKISIWAVPEGRVVHPNIPVAIIRGPFAMTQILESAFLNHMNYQTLVATKAARIRQAGSKNLLIDFGMRRAQGAGANAGSRAALIGGADFSSNTGVSYSLGYPPKGTHGHSMIQAFMALGSGELGAFEAFAELYPENCILLVDTISTLESGIPNAIKVFEKLQKKGLEPIGIRIDSGDLAYLSIEAAKMLNKAGFSNVRIVLSNELDELVIWQIINQIRQEAPKQGLDADDLIKRLAYGVGTKLIVSQGDSSLDGVYKLTSIFDKNKWIPAIKISESPSKTINPGFKYVHRIYDTRQKAVADLMSLEDTISWRDNRLNLHHPIESPIMRTLEKQDVSATELLLKEVMKDGKSTCAIPSIEEMRVQRDKDIDMLDEGVKRLINPHRYHVSVTKKLWDLKQNLINEQKVPNGRES